MLHLLINKYLSMLLLMISLKEAWLQNIKEVSFLTRQ